VNPRDVTTEQGSDTDTLSRRVLRRGIPYGDPFDQPGPRGLLFISYQTSITDQFEFLASSWMNSTEKPQSGPADGHDILVGQNPAHDAQRVCTAALRTDDGELRSFATAAPPWVFATGGGYFFAPSLPALTNVIAA
jgi:deferrochelatase/peroxidase EfeB